MSNMLCLWKDAQRKKQKKIELNHIKPVKEGGKYTVSKRQPLHLLCHICITLAKKMKS